MEECTVWDSQAQVYVRRKKSREEPVVTSRQGVNKRVEEEDVVGDQMVETRATTLGASSLEDDEVEGRVAGFFLQGKKSYKHRFHFQEIW